MRCGRVRFRANPVRNLQEATPEHPRENSIQRLRSTEARVIALDFLVDVDFRDACEECPGH